ncbi:MAG: hypothetical protein ACRDU0_10375 [Mycobacterium sp.]
MLPLADGGATELSNLSTQCGFHHLVAIHRWVISSPGRSVLNV